MIKSIMLILSVIFILLTFFGAGYVLYNSGNVSAGYAVISLALSLVCIAIYRENI